MKEITTENPKYCNNDYTAEKSFFFDHVHIYWDEQITFHQSDDWELSYIITGSGTRVIGNSMEVFSKGEIILIPPNLPHGWYFDEHVHDEEGKIENITIIFPESFLKRLADTFPETIPVIENLSAIKEGVCFEDETLKCLQAIMKSMSEQNNIEQLSSIINIFYKIGSSKQTRVVGAFEKQTKANLKIREVWRFMITNYQRNISLDEVAQHVGMNRSSFCTFYKREKGETFFTALNDLRIESSCQMLRETNIPIADICYAVGFNDVPHFNRTFKKIKGKSPNSYRNESSDKNG
ncbi:AraC family transcriptional regulator [Draconibacterium mangrovi]|uniref:AraC family transcriptional regulator n=1 Tax=Draconibacterium mangrovi TaxID=2697469 RepID=UPI0013D3192D|nr:AraC family transcriptional regulator [Draconibacterium mangrovi]